MAAIAAVAVAGVFGANALADEHPSTFGRHVAMCAHASLGQRAAPPAVTCTHEGMTMTFATFGEMVLHMKDEHD